MLAAAANRTSALGLFEVVLRTVDSQAMQVSEPLRVHAADVLKQAIEVAADPSRITASTAREAIELALRIRSDPALYSKLAAAAAATASTISPELAKDILDSLQPLAA
jgi:hypothetical protein